MTEELSFAAFWAIEEVVERNVMGRMKGGANNEDEAEKLTLGQLNTLIAAAEWRYKDDSRNSALRKSAFKRLVWLETQRERWHGIPAPRRRAHNRNSN